MTLRLFRSPIVALAISALVMAGCSLLTPPRSVPQSPQEAQFTGAEQIAGEIMAYLLEVTLGRAGNPQERSAWATRGLDLPLDFDMVAKRMFGPVPLRAELMVLDTNILGLSEVLYHYDRRLNLFKGNRDADSLFPCAELMAMRLFLAQKLNQREKVGLAAMLRFEDLFAPGSRDAQKAELAAMNLTDAEFRFLKAAFQSEPALFRYMRHPFLVDTLHKTGVAAQDALTVSAAQSANYRSWACPSVQALQPSPITIAILPAMNPLFDAYPATSSAVTPSREYQSILDRLENAILEGLARKRSDLGQTDQNAPQPVFFTPARPMVIHPGNAGRVIEDVCPKADFTLILLGKNVYRAIYFDPENDIYPHQKRVYLDVGDIQYQQIDDEIETIVNAVMPALTASASDPSPDLGLRLATPPPF